MKNPQFLSLRSKLSFLIFGLLLSVFSFGFYMTYNFFNLSNKSSLNSLNILARSASDSIGYNFSENYKDLKTLAGNLNLASLSQQELQNKLNQVISWHDNWDLILVVDPQGNYISSSTFDKNGKSVELESLRTQHYNESPWFRSVINKQFSEESSKNLKGVFVEEFIQDSILSAAFKESRYATSFSAVVTNSANQVVAVVTARANAQWIKRSLQTYFETIQSNYADVEFSVLNRDLRAIVEYSSAGSSSELNSKDYANSTIQIEERDKSNIKINKLNQLNGPGEGSIQIPGRKGLTLFSIETINSKNLLSFFNWKMLVKQPSSEFFSKHNEAGFWALMFFIGFMIFAILGSLFIVYSFNQNLQTLATDLTLAGNDITTSSFNINDSTERNSRNSQNQFSSLETISNSISHVSSTVQENISLAENATHLSDEINHLTVDTQKAMSELKQAMKSIHDSNQRIEALVKIIEEIGEKTEIIDDIVFKTQLLSFNASVEAERAGEHGRGFSVVAQEVGNLAQLSGKAATEIAGIVKNSIREANLVSKENKNRVEVGEELTKTTSSKLESVTQKLSNIFDITEKIATASKGQGSGLDQVAQELISVTQQLKSEAHNSSEHAKNVEELEKQSKKLLAVIDKIKYIAKAS